MPTYEYRCPECGTVQDHVHSIKQEPEFHCPACDTRMQKLISHNVAGFTIKGGTPTTHWREKRNRMKRQETLAQKQKDRYGDGVKVQPNIAGVRTDSWSDAQKMAKEAGLDHESYTPMVEKEKKDKNKLKVYTGPGKA